MNDPARANALSPALAGEITALYRRDLRGEGVRAILLAGAGRHFCSGADLEHLASLQSASELDNRLDSGRLRDLFEAILRQEAVTIALVHGSCVAGGCGLATASDFVVAAADARFLYSEVRIGFVAALVATYLPMRVSGRDLRELLLNPDFVPASRALEIGLANRVVPAGELAAAGEALAGEILAKASGESIARTKRLLLALPGLALDERLALAAETNALARATDDCRRGIATFLAEKRTPDWRKPA
jgi:methylglutaconyl-CoA hydratase